MLKYLIVALSIFVLTGCEEPLPLYSGGVTASVSLSWQPPQENADGTALTNLAGYRIYYGNRSRAYTSIVDIASPGIADHVLEGLTPGEYFLTMTSYNTDFVESNFSLEFRFRVNLDGNVTVV